MDARSILMAASAGIVFVFGAIHLVYTFWGTNLLPRDPQAIQAMKASPLVLTDGTTVWRAWIGFNASHSMALLLFGLVFGYLGVQHPGVLFGSLFLQGIGLLTLLGLLVLASLYWFMVPLVGVIVATACYVAALVVARV